MAIENGPDLIQEFLGSAHVFASAVSTVVEEKALREVAGDRLTFPQFKLLRLVAITDAHTLGDVAAFLGVSPTAAGKSVDRLVRRNLLRRSEGTTDRRLVQLTLTDGGRRLVRAYHRARDRKLAGLFRRFPADELRRVAELLDRLSAGLVGREADPGELCLQCGIYFRDRCLVRQLVNRECYYLRHKNRKGVTTPDS
jgi:DNA-binding MarR family transcriptional regulator